MKEAQTAEPCPRLSRSLVDYLDRLFPVFTPNLDTSERRIFHELGKRSVVELLKRAYEQQNQR